MAEFELQQLAGGLRAQGYDDAQITQVINQVMDQARIAQERQMLAAQRQALQPAAKQIAAQRLAQMYSAEGFTIDPTELMDAPSPEAMETKARTLQASYRRFALKDRAAQGTDYTPGESAGGTGAGDDWWLKGSSRSAWTEAFSRRRRSR